jgi:hypothetical protein
MLKEKQKKYLLFSFLIITINSSVFAQGNNLPYVDDKLIHFGFSLGINAMDFGILPSLQDINGKTYEADVSTLKPGFSVGIISDLRLNRYLNLRFTPSLHFGERELTYREVGTNLKDSVSITSIPISMPLYLKYSSERKGNYRPYLLWGGGAYLDLGRDKSKPVLLKPLDFYTEFGVGCDIYFSFFKLSPELKFALGFNDMFTPLDQRDAGFVSESDKKYSLALSKLTSRMFTLTFNFE